MSVVLMRLLLVSATIGVLGFTSCSSVQGVTPSCPFNVDDAGIDPEPSGCEQFAVCDANPANPTVCCVDLTGTPLTGNNLSQCLWGYGVASTSAGPSDGGS